MFASRVASRVLVSRAPSAKMSTGSSKNSFFAADEGAIGTKYFHMSALALMALVPTAIAYSPSSLNTPVDLLLGLVIPFHSHVGMNGVVSDYVPKAYRTLARSSVLGATVLMTLGFLRLNISGPGITETVKSLWRKTTKK